VRVIEATADPADSPGARKLIQTLARELDDTYTLFRGLLLPRADDAIDAVLVGPSGVLVMAIHEHTGLYACDGSEWFHSPDGGRSWEPGPENPAKRVLYNQRQLEAHLEREGVRDVRFEQAVICPNPKTQLVSQQPAVRLFDLGDLRGHAHRLAGQAYLTPAKIDDVVAVLQQTIRIASARSHSISAPTARRPAARSASDSLTPWLIVLGVLLLCNSAVCFGFAVVLFVQPR